MSARVHHYVTRAYLALFADDEGMVFVFDKSTGREFRANPKNVAAIAHFNTVLIDGKPSDAIEKAIGGAEGAGVRALVALRSGAEITEQERADLAWFIALHFARNPAARRFGDDAVAELAKWVDESVEAFQRNTGITIEAKRPDLSLSKDDHVANMLDIADRAWRGLGRRGWLLATVPAMLTGDFPVVPLADPSFPGVGLSTATEIYFAAGPSHALVLGTHGEPGARTEASTEQALAIRQRMWLHADRYTVRRPGTEPPTGIDLRERRVWGLLPRS